MNERIEQRDSPTVGIVIPNVGQSQFVDEAIQSVSRQTFANWNAIVVTDDELCSSRLNERWHRDSRIRIVSLQKTVGVSAARNKGIRELGSKFVVALDADDIIGKKYFERATAVLQAYNHVKVVDCRAWMFGDKRGEMKLPPFSRESLAQRNVICTPAMFRMVDFEEVGGYDETMTSGLEDWEFWLAVLKGGGTVLRLDTVEYFYRQHPNSTTRRLTIGDWFDAKQYVFQKHHEFFESLSTAGRKTARDNGRFITLGVVGSGPARMPIKAPKVPDEQGGA
jgi:glycosyltransferase involved in cell wall biosynthesis